MNADLVGISLLAPALLLAKTTYVLAKALAYIHARLETLVSTIDLQTISDNSVDWRGKPSIGHVTDRRQLGLSSAPREQSDDMQAMKNSVESAPTAESAQSAAAPGPLLDFNTLLRLAQLDPKATLIVRHFPQEKSLRRVLPWLVVERPDLWLAYQRIQWASLEKAMTRGRYMASFIGQQPGQASFAGIYRIGGGRVIDHAGYWGVPGNSELKELGMTGRDPDMPDCLLFDLEPLDAYREWIGRLTIRWPKPYQNWWRWGGRGTFAVSAIEAESRFVRGMPHWKELVLNWHELQSLPASWETSLAQWRGIYLIYDAGRRSGYVGSAYGTDNILGRWSNYAASGHGGNVELRKSEPADLRFSILERTSPDLDAADIIALEASWKERLHTREFGLNRN